jgi:hypothetical protein
MPAIKPQNICPIYIPNQYIYIVLYISYYILLNPLKNLRRFPSPKDPRAKLVPVLLRTGPSWKWLSVEAWPESGWITHGMWPPKKTSETTKEHTKKRWKNAVFPVFSLFRNASVLIKLTSRSCDSDLTFAVFTRFEFWICLHHLHFQTTITITSVLVWNNKTILGEVNHLVNMCTEPRNLWKSLWPNDNRCGTVNIAPSAGDSKNILKTPRQDPFLGFSEFIQIGWKLKSSQNLSLFWVHWAHCRSLWTNARWVKMGAKTSSGPSNCRESAKRSRTKSMPWAERCAGPCFGRDSPTKYCFVLCGVGWTWRHSQYITGGDECDELKVLVSYELVMSWTRNTNSTYTHPVRYLFNYSVSTAQRYNV